MTVIGLGSNLIVRDGGVAGVVIRLSAKGFGEIAVEDGHRLRVGAAAPDFKLQYFDGKDLKDVSLSQYRGKQNVVLAFYIFAFTGG